ncbi:MAG TPA: ABC transporter permease [Cytophagales bacterium]|nr:ABC transporter permease [Cytophagales bacterium]
MNNTLLKLIIIQIKDFIREPEILFWSILFPIGISGVLGLAFMQKEELVREVAFVSHNRGSVEAYENRLNSELFKFDKSSEEEALLKIKRGEIQLYIKEDPSGTISYHFDPVNAEAQLTYLMLEKELTKEKSEERPTVEITTTGNRYIDFLIPGLLALGIMNSCIWGIGWNLIDSRIKKLLRRMVATPMKKSTFLTAQMITRLMVSFCEGLILFVFAHLFFGVEIQGSIPGLILIFVSGTFAFAGIAILISSRAENAQVGNGLINAIVLPLTIVSGVFFSYHNFPDWIENLVRFLPLTILADNIRAIFNEGASITSVLLPSFFLLITGFVTFIAGLRIYKWY